MKAKREENEYKRQIKEGIIFNKSKEEKEEEKALFVQKRIRGILGRKRVEEMRQEEMIFLGMARKAKTKDEIKNDPI